MILREGGVEVVPAIIGRNNFRSGICTCDREEKKIRAEFVTAIWRSGSCTCYGEEQFPQRDLEPILLRKLYLPITGINSAANFFLPYCRSKFRNGSCSSLLQVQIPVRKNLYLL